MRSISRKFRTWVKRLWEPKPDWDWLEMTYQAMMPEVGDEDSDRLETLLKDRERAKKAKKKHRHLDREIELLRAKIMGRTA